MPWTKAQRQKWRAALRIHRQLVKSRLERETLELPHTLWQRLVARKHLHQNALDSQWAHAQADLENDLQRMVSDLVLRSQELLQSLKQRREQIPLITLPELWRELQFLEAEYEEVECDLKEMEVRVTTPSIEIEGIDLGRFQIILEWNHLGSSHCYRIKALDPNPATSNEDMVHPHVNNEVLCEGSGAASIKEALQQGRLFDFFLIVQQILLTYNPDSAYLKISLWSGQNCQSCSTLMDEDEATSCPCCGDQICRECSGYCENCTDTMCQGCVKACPHCDNYFCTHCMIHCSACMADGCDACLSDGLCSNCQPNEETDDDESTESPDDEEDEQACTTADSVCLGQAALSA